MASSKLGIVRRLVSFVICFVMLGMQVLPVGAALLSGDNIVADAAPTISAPLAPQNDECPQDGNSCFSTDGIKVSDIFVNADGEVQISGYVDFPAMYAYEIAGGNPAGGGGLLNNGESGEFTETFGPFEIGTIFKFHIEEDSASNPERFPDYMNNGPYVEEFGYRVYVEAGDQPLDVGQGAYDWEGKTGDEVFLSFLRGYFRNLDEGRDLGTAKHKTGSPWGAAVHEWDGYLVQDFVGDGGTTVYHGVMIYNHNRCRTYAVVNGILDAYWDAGGPGGWLSVPVSDEYERSNIDDDFRYLYIGFSDWIHWLQRFEHGFISSKNGINYDDYLYHPVGGNIDLYVYTTNEGKGRVYLSLDIDSVPGLPDAETLEAYITGPGEGDMWPITQGADGRYYGHYGHDLDFGTSINLSILIIRSSDDAIGVVPRDQYGIDIPIERGYEKNGIDLLPDDLISDVTCDSNDPGTRPPSIYVADENWNIVRNWDYLAKENVRFIAYVYDGRSDFQGTLTSQTTGKNVKMDFKRQGGSCEYRASIPVNDIITEKDNEITIVSFGKGDVDNILNHIPDLYTLRGIARGGGYEGDRCPPANLTFLKASGFEDVKLSISGFSEQPQVFVKNQADNLIYTGHGGHPKERCQNTQGEWVDDCNTEDTVIALNNLGGEEDWAGFTPTVNPIGNSWKSDLDLVLFFACSLLDVNDYNAQFDEDWKPGVEKGPYWKSVTNEEDTPWHPGERWSDISGPTTWLGFAAYAPLMDDNQKGEDVLVRWLDLMDEDSSDSISNWKDAVEAYKNNAGNASAIGPSGYYVWRYRLGKASLGFWKGPIGSDRWQPEASTRSFENFPESLMALNSGGQFPLSPPLLVYVTGPLEVHLYNRQGKHTGELVSGGIEEGIPNSSYEILDEGILLTVEGGDVSEYYEIYLTGTGEGNANLWLSAPDHIKGHMQEASYEDLPITLGSNYHFVLDRGSTVLLEEDIDGDYIFENSIKPTDWEMQVRTASAPEIHMCGMRGNQGWFTGDIDAVFSNPDLQAIGIQYSFDGEWVNYTDPISLTSEGITDFAGRAVYGDEASLPIRFSAKIDKTSPESTVEITSALPLVENNIYTSDVTIVLTGTDPVVQGVASGLNYIEYRLNDGAWLKYDAEMPPVVTQNGENIFEYRAIDIASNVEPTHVVPLTLDKSVNTIIPLDATQTNRQAAIRAVMQAILNDQHPLMAAQAFIVNDEAHPTGTVIVPGEVTGDFTKAVHVGPLDIPTAHVLYPQAVVLFESDSPDERASWELPDLRKAMETYLGLHEWPRVDETDIASDTTPSDVVYFPAGVTPDVAARFAETGAMDALVAQAEAGRWFVFEGDAAQIADFAGLVPPGTVEANALPAGVSPLTPVQTDTILAYNWPEAMTLTRYNDAPRFHITGDLVRVADYADEALGSEPAIVMRRVGEGGVILIGGHAAQDTLSYSLLHNALFTAAAEQVDSRVSVEQQFMPGAPLDTVPGLEPEIPVLVRSTVANYGQDAVNDFVYTEFITSGYKLLSSPAVDIGEIMTKAVTPSYGTLILQAGTWITWTADTLPPGSHELTYRAANVMTDTLKPGEVTIGEAQFRYTDSQTRTVQLTRPDAVVRAKLPALIAHNPTDEPDNVYPLPAGGTYVHIRHDLENKLETRANNTFYTVTVPFFDIVRDAYDQTIFPYAEGTQENGWVMNEIYGYPERDYLIPVHAPDKYWYYTFEDWDCDTWVRIPNPRQIAVNIPSHIQDFAYQEANNGDIWVAGKTLVFDLGTMLPYDQKEPAIRYMVRSLELYGRGVSFSVEPITGTLVLEGNGGSVYTAVGQHPVPFREYFDDAAVNNPIAPVPSAITYTDLWGRAHAVTETVRSAFYDIIPYDKTGDAVSVQMASTYGMTGESGERLFDFPPYQVVTLTVMIKAQSVNRDLSAEQLIIQEMLPRGLGYDIEFVTWEASNDSFRLLDENTISVPAFDLLYFQGALPENDPQTITITARLRAYPQNPREGQTLVDGGARIATQNEWGDPSQFDTAMTHVRVEQAYQASTEIEKWVASPDVSRHGGTIYELIRTNGAADVTHFTEEVYIDSTGTGDKSAVAKTGMSFGPDLYFGTVEPGGETLLVYELTNNSGEAWHNVGLTYTTHPGISLTPILTDGLEPPPNVYDTPYLWAEEIPDISRGVYYYRVHVDESVPAGVMYPIVFTLTGDNVPDADEFPLPVARVGVGGGEIRRIQGQATAIQVVDTSPSYATPTLVKGMTEAQFTTAQTITEPEALDDFFAALTRTLPFTYSVVDDLNWITYTIPAEWQTLPAQEGTEIQQAWALLVQTEIGDVEPGTRLVNHGPQAPYTDTHGAAFTADGNPTHVIAHGPVLTGSYTINSITSPFYGGAVIEPMPGESAEVCIDIAVWNEGNYVASDPVISATISSVVAGFQIVSMDPEPITQDEGGTTFTWALDDILPYGSTGEDSDQDMEHIEVCVQFTAPNEVEIKERLAMLQNSPFYVPLVQSSHARYVDDWGDVPFTIQDQVGGQYGIHVGQDSLSAPELFRATWDDTRNRTILDWTAVPGARDYVVYRSTEPDRDFHQVGRVTDGTRIESYVYDDPLTSIYYYVIRARDENLFEGRHSQVRGVYTNRETKLYLPLVLKQ